MSHAVVIGSDGRGLATSLAQLLQLDLLKYEVDVFADGEIKAQVPQGLQQRHCIVVVQLQHAGSPLVNGEFLGVLMLLKQLRRQGVRKLTLVMPYLPYTRVACVDDSPLMLLLEHINEFTHGKIVAVDVHDESLFQAHKEIILTLDSTPVWSYSLTTFMRGLPVCVVSPDAGGVNRAERLAARLAVPAYGMLKQRGADGSLTQHELQDDVAGKIVFLRDDMIDTGRTAISATKLLKERGAQQVIGCFTHPILSADMHSIVAESGLDAVLFTNTLEKRGLNFPYVSLDGLLVTALQQELLGGKRTRRESKEQAAHAAV